MKELYNQTERLRKQIENLKKGIRTTGKGRGYHIKYEQGTKQSDYNIDKLERFCYKESSSGNKKNLQKLCILQEFGYWLNKPFNEITEQEAKDYNFELQQSKLKFLTIEAKKQVLRHFYKWLEMENIVKCFQRRKSEAQTNKLPEELLTNDDISDLIRHSRNNRNKCFISVLYESGARISELRTLKIKHLSFQDLGVKMTLTGKTGMRRILLRDSMPYIKTLLNEHPQSNDREAYLFLNKYEGMWGYTPISNMLKDTFKRAKIQKKSNPHLFRHSRASYLANFLTEQQLKVYFGWSKDSNMASVYVHLSGSNIDNALLGKVYQVKKIQEEAQESKLKPQECPKCKELNEASHKFCGKCSCPLDYAKQEQLAQLTEAFGSFVSSMMAQGKVMNEENTKALMREHLAKNLLNVEAIPVIK